jgi:hypothetical protein
MFEPVPLTVMIFHQTASSKNKKTASNNDVACCVISAICQIAVMSDSH